MEHRPIRVAVVDDNPRFCKRMRTVLSADPGIEFVGEAANGRAAVDLAVRRRPDVMLMDLHMPGWSGVDATHEILRELPETRVLFLSATTDDERVTEALLAGASGYVLKSAPARALLAAVEAVHGGETYLSPQIATLLMRRWREHEAAAPTGRPAAPESTLLSARELDVLRLLADGRENTEIAGQLGISLNTVKGHVRAILEKLGAENRTAAAVKAVRDELI